MGCGQEKQIRKFVMHGSKDIVREVQIRSLSIKKFMFSYILEIFIKNYIMFGSNRKIFMFNYKCVMTLLWIWLGIDCPNSSHGDSIMELW